MFRETFGETPRIQRSVWNRVVREGFLAEEVPQLHSRRGGLGKPDGSREGIPNASQENALNIIVLNIILYE